MALLDERKHNNEPYLSANLCKLQFNISRKLNTVYIIRIAVYNLRIEVYILFSPSMSWKTITITFLNKIIKYISHLGITKSDRTRDQYKCVITVYISRITVYGVFRRSTGDHWSPTTPESSQTHRRDIQIVTALHRTPQERNFRFCQNRH